MKRIEKVIKEIKENLKELTDYEQNVWLEVELETKPYKDKLAKFYYNCKETGEYRGYFKGYEHNPCYNDKSYELLVKDFQCLLADLIKKGEKEKVKTIIKKVYYK